jgi:hypothetical protein
MLARFDHRDGLDCLQGLSENVGSRCTSKQAKILKPSFF